MRVFVIGGTGLVGRNLTQQFRSAGHDVQSTHHTSADGADIQLDKRDETASRDVIESFGPDAVIEKTRTTDKIVRHMEAPRPSLPPGVSEALRIDEEDEAR